jgi:hypothetical protein
MSPTVPPTSTMTTPFAARPLVATLPVPSRATRAMRSLISLVMCGMTCTVPPR